ncbi:MAG: hypothetical protein GY867_00495 [bacterium]|nr:hypothetical protein [bacterium]
MTENMEAVAGQVTAEHQPRKRGRKSLLTPVERAIARKEYQRQYYQKNRDKAKQYQREYNLLHRKKTRIESGENGIPLGRPAVKSVYTIRDIMSSSPEKSVRMLDMILGGKRSLTM